MWLIIRLPISTGKVFFVHLAHPTGFPPTHICGEPMPESWRSRTFFLKGIKCILTLFAQFCNVCFNNHLCLAKSPSINDFQALSLESVQCTAHFLSNESMVRIRAILCNRPVNCCVYLHQIILFESQSAQVAQGPNFLGKFLPLELKFSFY